MCCREKAAFPLFSTTGIVNAYMCIKTYLRSYTYISLAAECDPFCRDGSQIRLFLMYLLHPSPSLFSLLYLSLFSLLYLSYICVCGAGTEVSGSGQVMGGFSGRHRSRRYLQPRCRSELIPLSGFATIIFNRYSTYT